MNETDSLDILEAHFKTLERFEVRIPGLPEPLYSKPLTFEESLRLVHALRETNPAKQAQAHASLIVAKLETQGGNKAFLGNKHFTAEQRLLRGVSPTALSDIIARFQEHLEEAAEELEKKSEDQGQAF